MFYRNQIKPQQVCLPCRSGQGEDEFSKSKKALGWEVEQDDKNYLKIK